MGLTKHVFLRVSAQEKPKTKVVEIRPLNRPNLRQNGRLLARPCIDGFGSRYARVFTAKIMFIEKTRVKANQQASQAEGSGELGL